jgi:hypothetical protein
MNLQKSIFNINYLNKIKKKWGTGTGSGAPTHPARSGAPGPAVGMHVYEAVPDADNGLILTPLDAFHRFSPPFLEKDRWKPGKTSATLI